MKKIILSLIVIAPRFASARTFGEVLGNITDSVLTPLINLSMVVATVIFLWGVLGYIRSAGEEDVSEAKRFIVYGLVGLFLMASVWGLVKIISTTILESGSSSDAPQQQTLPTMEQWWDA